MLDFFRKRNRIKEEDYRFLRAVVTALPSKYSFLVGQVSEEFILNKKVNKLGDKGTYSLILNAELESKFSNKSLPYFFILKDIYIWNEVQNAFDQIELHVLEGMLAGFKIYAKYSQLDLTRIDTTQVKEKLFKDEDKEYLVNLIGHVSQDILAQLDIKSTFKIEIEEGDFYVIKDLQDGNYLSMDENGAVYGMIHDPYEIEKLFDTKEDFFLALKSRSFIIEEYYNRKMS